MSADSSQLLPLRIRCLNLLIPTPAKVRRKQCFLASSCCPDLREDANTLLVLRFTLPKKRRVRGDVGGDVL